MNSDIVSLVSLLLSVTIPAYLVYKQKRAEAHQVAAEKAVDRNAMLVDQLQEEVTRLREDLKKRDQESTVNYIMIQDLRREVSEFRWGVMKLIQQLHELGEIPVWTPETETKGTKAED